MSSCLYHLWHFMHIGLLQSVCIRGGDLALGELKIISLAFPEIFRAIDLAYTNDPFRIKFPFFRPKFLMTFFSHFTVGTDSFPASMNAATDPRRLSCGIKCFQTLGRNVSSFKNIGGRIHGPSPTQTFGGPFPTPLSIRPWCVYCMHVCIRSVTHVRIRLYLCMCVHDLHTNPGID